MNERGHRTALWLPVLRALTDTAPRWAVWKRADPAFDGEEDIDALAPVEEWPVVERVFTRWSREHGYPVVVCRHIPWTLNLFAVLDDKSLLQLETKDRTTFRGAVQLQAVDLAPLTQIDPRGFRILRPGAEAAMKLTLHGLTRGGRPNRTGLVEHDVIAQLRNDRPGADALAEVSSMARQPLLRAIAAAEAGGWDRGAMIALERDGARRAVANPSVGARRLWFRHVVRPRCPVLQTVYAGKRRIAGDVDAWLAEAARDHVVVSDRPRPAMRRRGRFVAIVGPDGVGKTTIARTLLERYDGPTGYVYFRPPLDGRLPTAPPAGPKPRGDKNPRREPAPLGWLRLGKNIVWFWVGYLRVVRPMVRKGGLVVGDRWGYGYVVQPGPLRFFGPPALARAGVRLLPRPDLVVNLVAPPEVVAERKDELTVEEVGRELEAWAGLPVPRMQTFDAVKSPDELAEDITARLGALPM